MLATLAGFLALLLGLLLLLLPLFVTELSRPRDSAWGAVVLLLGLVLVTSAERLTGAPMLAVLCGGLLVGRLGGEVAQGRWRALSDEERQALRSAERWNRSFNQLAAVAASLLQSTAALVAAVSLWLAERRQGRSHGKRWVRAETGEPRQSESVDAPASPAAEEAAEAKPADLPPPDSSLRQRASAEATANGSDTAPDPAQPLASDSLAEASAGQATATLPEPASDRAEQRPAAPASGDPGVRVVADFAGVDALLAAAPEASPPPHAEDPSSPPDI